MYSILNTNSIHNIISVGFCLTGPISPKGLLGTACTRYFTYQMPFLSLDQQCQSTEEIYSIHTTQKLVIIENANLEILNTSATKYVKLTNTGIMLKPQGRLVACHVSYGVIGQEAQNGLTII